MVFCSLQLHSSKRLFSLSLSDTHKQNKSTFSFLWPYMGCRSSDKPKPKHRKGLWSPEEDQKLRNYVLKHGHGCWSSVPINAGLRRNGKSCRLRWINYLRPGLKRGTFSLQEEETILNLHRLLGNKWSQMAQHLPGRTDNEIKNYWHSHLKKKIHKADHGVLEEPNVHDTSSDNLESNNTDQSVVQLSDHSPKKAYRSSLPKLMFAEWLSLDSFSSLNEPIMGSLDQNNSRFHDNFMQGCVLNEGTFCNSEFHNSISDASAEEMFSSQFRFEWESSGNDQFVDFGSGEGICSEFTVNNDLMFIQNYKH